MTYSDQNKILLDDKTIESFKTIDNGYTKQQLHILGIQWPPIKGWKKEILKRKVYITRKEYDELIYYSYPQ